MFFRGKFHLTTKYNKKCADENYFLCLMIIFRNDEPSVATGDAMKSYS